MITTKALLDVALYHTATTTHTHSFIAELLAEYYKSDKHLIIDIDAIANRNEYDAYILITYLQEGAYDVNVDAGTVTAHSIHEFYHTILRMFELIQNYREAQKIGRFISFLQTNAKFDITNAFSCFSLTRA